MTRLVACVLVSSLRHQQAAACPEGARGVAGACYILVAKGPRGAATCAWKAFLLVPTV